MSTGQEVDRALAMEIVGRLNRIFGDEHYQDVRLLGMLNEHSYIALDVLIYADQRLLELTGGSTALIKAALQIVPSNVLQVSRDKKYIRRLKSEVRIVRYLDNLFKDNSGNNSDLLGPGDGDETTVWITHIFSRRPEFNIMASSDVSHVASACLRGR